MKKLSLIFVLALAVVAGVAQTQFTATYTFGTGGSVQSFAYNGTQYSGITMSNINKVGQIESVNSPGNFRAKKWPTATQGYTATEYIGFTINAKPGYKFTVNSITFGLGKSKDGPRLAQWRGSANTYGAALTNYTTLASGVTNSAGELTLGNYSNDPGSWTGNVLNPGTAYHNISSCGFRLHFYATSNIAFNGGLDGPITITGSYTPSIEVSVSQLPLMTVQQSAGPSSPQSFTVSAVGLSPNHSLMIKTPDGYELAHAESGPYSSGSGTFSVISDGNGYVAPTPVYVRMREGLYAGNYNGNVEIIYEVPDPDVVKLVAVTGTVTHAPEYYVAFEKSYETLADYSATATSVRLGVNEIDGTLNEGYNWNMTQVKTGTNTGFVINGSKSARLRGYGTTAMTMTQEKPNGAGLVTFCYRRYSEDAQVDWKVEYSLNQEPWIQLGSTFTAIAPPTPREIETFTGYIDDSRPVRIRIVRGTADSNTMDKQLNIDCIRVTHYYDFPAGVDRTVLNDQITVTGGNANYSIINTQTSPVPNIANFTPSFHRCLTLLGSGPWTFSVTNQNANWIAYKQGDTWTTSPMTNGSGSITVPASRSTEIELLTGNGNDPTLPVTLSHFSATLTAQNYVQLTWVSQTETNLLGYHVFRGVSAELSSAEKISDLIGATNTSNAQTYVYLDKDADQDGTYYYWLQNVDMDGTMGYHGPVSVVFTIGGNGGAPAIPTFTKLENAYPNPFNPNTTINYQLKDPGLVKIDIYNTRGQILRSFEHRHAEAGHYGFLWDGRDGSGRELPSGVYLLKMRSGTYVGSKKVVLQK